MEDLEKEIGKLYETTARTRYEFIQTELQSCWTALEIADYQLSVGNPATAASEVAFVTRGIAVLHRFLPLTSEEHQLEIEKKLEELEAALVTRKAKLNPDV
jgi:hypothetical protein